MIDYQASAFVAALDDLARTIDSKPLGEEAKGSYWKVFQSHSFEMFLAAIAHLKQNFKPRWRDHFPVPAEILEAIEIVSSQKTPEPPSRDYEAIKAGFKKRGILIGEEARIRLEADWNRRMKTAREGLAQDDPEDYQA